jgi:hypothetical protein
MSSMNDVTTTGRGERAPSAAAVAALPDLLEAAQEALWALDPYAALVERGMWHSDDNARAIRLLRSAIAKATSVLPA